MKNLNPVSGLKQITNGYICLPRRMVVELLKNKKIKQLELGYFIIFLISADWDTDVFRNGFIRHELPRLSKIWGIPYTTLQEHATNLVEKQLLITEKDTLKINNFERFTSGGAQTFVKNKPTDQDLKKLFPELFSNSGISEDLLAGSSSCFKDSSKVNSGMYSKRVVIRQDGKSEEEYQKIYRGGGFERFTPDDMRWIDENVTEEIDIDNDETEKQIVEAFFDGDWNEYRRNLKIN